MDHAYIYGNQSIGAAYFLHIFPFITVTSLWSWSLLHGLFILIITWCFVISSAPFILPLMMNISQYYVKMLLLNCSFHKSFWNQGIVLYFLINSSLPLNGKRNSGSFSVKPTTYHIQASYQPSQPSFCTEKPLHPASTEVPTYTPTNPTLQSYLYFPTLTPPPVAPSLITGPVTPMS